MVTGLLGKKLGMTQIFDSNNQAVAVTVLEVGPCGIVQVKTKDKDGYEAVQIGFQEVPERKLNKPKKGHLQSKQARLWRYLREVSGSPDNQVGALVDVGLFAKGDRVAVQGVSKGKGFQGVMKRHHYGGGPASHGSMFHRAPGSIGSSSFPSRVWKNKGLPGQMGGKRVTVRGLRVVDVREEENLLLVSGAVPGRVGGVVLVKKMEKV
ncbi:MAG: 50S ribosomal protein L3 [Nitrospirae bacterium]|nr:MAG: 50S ribosomal protein L3 [Nitrospirota bacterium]